MPAEPSIKFQRSTPVLKAADYARSKAFYTEKLGYTVVEEGGEPPQFGIFDRDTSVLFVNAWQGGPTPVPGSWDAYIHVAGVEAVHAELAATGVEIIRQLEVTVYGMREFEIRDPDGNVLCFGEDAEKSAG
jgi:catechol 2,3-dioxygenase-like lactoylglutathione lyase family enzyme